MARTLPLPCLSAINIFNIREMLEKCIDENGLATSGNIFTIQKWVLPFKEHFLFFLFLQLAIKLGLAEIGTLSMQLKTIQGLC